MKYILCLDKTQTREDFEHYMGIVEQRYGDLRINRAQLNGLDFSQFNNLGEMIAHFRDKYRIHEACLLDELPESNDVKTHLLGQLNHALSACAVIVEAVQALSEQRQSLEQHLDFINFWLLHNATLSLNLATVIYQLKDGILVAVPPKLMRSSMFVESIPMGMPRERIQVLLGSVAKWCALVEYQMSTSMSLQAKHEAPLQRVSHFLHSNKAFIFPNHGRIKPEALKDWTSQKNIRNVKLGLPSRHEIVFNPEAYQIFNLDPVAFANLIKIILEVYQGQRGRTQVSYFLQSPHCGHAQALDISMHEGKLNIIHIDPAGYRAQHIVLSKITEVLNRADISFSVLACAANLYEGHVNNDIHAYALASLLGKVDIAELMTQANAAQPRFKDPLFELNPPQDMARLEAVHWFPLHALGPKAVCMAHDPAKVKAGLRAINARKADERFDNFVRFYGLNFAEGRTYLDYRRETLMARIEGKPFKGLSIEQVRARLKMTGEEDISRAVRLLAAGFGPRVYFDFLIEKLETEQLECPGMPSGNTPLHNALLYGKSHRAALLLAKDLKTNQENAAGKTQQQILDQAEDSQIKALLAGLQKLRL